MPRFIFTYISEIVAGVALCGLAVVVFLQVFYRYVLQKPLSWSEELVLVIFVWCTFLGAAIAVRKKSHFALDIFSKTFSPQVTIVVSVLSDLIIATIASILIFHGTKMVLFTWHQYYPVLGFSVAYCYLAFPISGLLILVYTISNLKKTLLKGMKK